MEEKKKIIYEIDIETDGATKGLEEISNRSNGLKNHLIRLKTVLNSLVTQ